MMYFVIPGLLGVKVYEYDTENGKLNIAAKLLVFVGAIISLLVLISSIVYRG